MSLVSNHVAYQIDDVIKITILWICCFEYYLIPADHGVLRCFKLCKVN